MTAPKPDYANAVATLIEAAQPFADLWDSHFGATEKDDDPPSIEEAAADSSFAMQVTVREKHVARLAIAIDLVLAAQNGSRAQEGDRG